MQDRKLQRKIERENYIEKRMLESHMKERETYFCMKDCKKISIMRETALRVRYGYEFDNGDCQ